MDNWLWTLLVLLATVALIAAAVVLPLKFRDWRSDRRYAAICKRHELEMKRLMGK